MRPMLRPSIKIDFIDYFTFRVDKCGLTLVLVGNILSVVVTKACLVISGELNPGAFL